MPKVFEEKGYVFRFVEHDLGEPVHVHVHKSGREAKIWVNPISVAKRGRFKDHELDEIERIIRKRRNEILAAWERELRKR